MVDSVSRMKDPGGSWMQLGHGTALAALALVLSACGGERPAQGGQAVSPPSPAATPRPDHSAFVAAVDALAAEALERGPIAGLSIAVQARGAEVLARDTALPTSRQRQPRPPTRPIRSRP